jgi:GDPmannose 4,6-dehydratase
MQALVTGITGQDGRYLAPELIKRGIKVFGLSRLSRSQMSHEILVDLKGVELYKVDINNFDAIKEAIRLFQPDYIFNLAAFSSVGQSYYNFEDTIKANLICVENILRAVTQLNMIEKTRIYQASSSEIFGKAAESPQTETSERNPISPYGLSKFAAQQLCKQYLEQEGLFISCGILFNHESPKRSEEFVTRKITKGVAQIQAGLKHELLLGNLNAQRDWGFAGEYVVAMILMLQNKIPEDFVIATGRSHSVLDLVKQAFIAARMPGAEEQYLRTSSTHLRPYDHMNLIGNSSYAKSKLNWEAKVHFSELIKMMVESDMRKLET